MAKIPVTVYTTPSCPQCEMTKKMLTREGVEFDVVDLSEHPEKVAEFKEQGLLSAPIVTTDVKVWSGFKPAKIQSLASFLFGENKA
jgi:glutaredoxin-like protein NrdH